MLHVSHFVNSVFSSRTYVLSREGSLEIWLVDCGDVDKLPKGINVKGVLLTHAHFDHIYGLPKLLGAFHDCNVVTNIDGLKTLSDSRANMSKYHECPIDIYPLKLSICKNGDTIELFDGIHAKVYETAGHHPSCLTFEVEDYLFTGDSYIPNCKVVTNLPGGDNKMAEVSVQRILEISKGKILCPGHEYE